MPELTLAQRYQVVCSLVIGLIDEKKKISKDFYILAQARHNNCHEGEMMSCVDETCLRAVRFFSEGEAEEALFHTVELEALATKKLYYGSPLAGTIRVWLKEKSNLITV